MISSPNVILAIAPGKRELGIAVFIGADLAYVSVKTIKHRQSKTRLLKDISGIMQKLFDGFSVERVTVKAISQYQKLSPDLELIVRRIKSEAAANDLPVTEVTLDHIKFVLSESERSTEKKAFESLLLSYPELDKYWNRPNKWQNDYYAFLFSAVAAGVVYLRSLSKKE
jgi:hypothetical protein